jgi:hypothetical protein
MTNTEEGEEEGKNERRKEDGVEETQRTELSSSVAAALDEVVDLVRFARGFFDL